MFLSVICWMVFADSELILDKSISQCKSLINRMHIRSGNENIAVGVAAYKRIGTGTAALKYRLRCCMIMMIPFRQTAFGI